MSVAGLACLLGAVASAASGPVLREEAKVKVDGVTERWRLEWRAPPELECLGIDAVTCPCAGFGYAERGELDLVRLRPGGKPERFALTPLFEPNGASWGGSEKNPKPQAMLRRWERPENIEDEELEETPPEKRAQLLARRKSARAMVFGDYDRDGQAREFVLQTEAYGCGMQYAVLIGVGRDGKLRALGTAEHPDTPLVLKPWTWAELLKSADFEAVETPCGDHGSEEENVVHVRADKQGLHVTRELFKCTEKGERGERESTEAL